MCAAIPQPTDAPNRATQPPQFACLSNGRSSAIIDEENSTSPPMHASQHQPFEPDNTGQAGRTIAAALTTQGVRVRDFAYENTLPPVISVPRFSVQVQPRPRLLKRTRDMLDGHDADEESDEEDPRISRTWCIDSNENGVSHGYRYRKRATLERTLTEPADGEPLSQSFNLRAPALTQPFHRYRLPPAPLPPHQEGPQCPSTPQRSMRHSQSQSPNRFLSPITTVPHSQPSAPGESQETEPWIDTPLVTPNGSLQWPVQVQNTSAVPASQLESVLPQLADGEHNDLTLSQLGFSPERSQATSAPSPAGTPSRSRRPEPRMPPTAEFNTRARSVSPSKPRSTPGSPARPATRSPAPCAPAPAPRYDLRQRPAAVKPPPAPRATSRTRVSGQAAARASEKTAPPSKKRKVTPPKKSSAANGATSTGRGHKKTTDVKSNK